MDSRLKQRLVGAAVLVALAVIFLPMLVKGPAPDSGVSDLPMRVPDAPRGDYGTVDLPLVAPPGAPDGGVLGPTPSADAAPAADAAAAPAGEPVPAGDGGDAPAPESAGDQRPGPPPATTAAGDYAVHFGAFATAANAQTILAQLRDAAGLEGYSEPATINGRSAYRVRIGPFATRAEAEAVRVRAARVRDDVKPRVIALDAEAGKPREAAAQPAAAAAAPAPAPAATTATTTATTTTTTTTTTTAPPPREVPAAAGVGFVVQVVALRSAADATAMRDRLRAQGITAFTDPVDTGSGVLTRVKAGPVPSREDAERLKSRVKSAVGVDGIVRQHP